MHISCSHALLGQEPFPGRVADYDYGPGWDEDLSYARLDAFTSIFQNVRIPVWLVQVRRLKLYIYIYSSSSSSGMLLTARLRRTCTCKTKSTHTNMYIYVCLDTYIHTYIHIY